MGFKLSDDAPVTSFRLSSALEDPAEAPAPAQTAKRMSSALESIGPEKTDKPGSWRYPSDGPRVWQEDAPEEQVEPIAEADVVQPGKSEPSRGRSALERQMLPEIEVAGVREKPPVERPKKLIKEGHYEKRYMRGEPVDVWIPAQYDDGTASFGEAMSEVPHQVIARGDKMIEGGKHMVAADRASGARKRVWQATVLPQAYKEWQEYNNSRIDERERKNLDEMPSVIRGAELAGVRPDQFARDWPDFVNKTPEDLSKDRQADLKLFNEQKAKRDKARKGIKLANQLASDYRPEMDDWSPTAIAFDALSSLPDLAAGVGVTAATGSPGAGLGFLFATTAPVAYADAIEGGATEGQAHLYAMLYGLAEVAPETPVMDVLAKTGAGKKIMARVLGKWGDSAGVRVATAAGFEGASESLTQSLQLAIDAGVINKDTPLNEALEQIARAGVTGSVMGGSIGAVGEGGSAIRERQARKKTPPQQKPTDDGPSLSTAEAEAAEEPEDHLQLEKVKKTAAQYASPEELAAADALPEEQQLLKLQEFVDRGTDYSRPPAKGEEPAKETKARLDQDAVYENTEDQDVQQAAKVAKEYAKPEEIEAALALPTAKERLAALQPLVDRGITFGEPTQGDMPEGAVERRAEPRQETGTELAQPGQSEAAPRLEALKAVREGKATPEQVAQLESEKLVIRSETNVPRLLPAGRRELAKAEGQVVETKVHGQEITVNVKPSEAQKAAGNYEKGNVKLFGMDLAIENPAGSERAWSNPDTGESGSRTMKYPYGYVKRTEGADGDAVDVFIGPNDKSKKVFVINQMKGDGSGKFDEHKAMLGFNNAEHAKAGYLRHYQKGWKGMGEVVEMTTDEFREWAKSGDTTQPIASTPARRMQFSTSKILAPPGQTGMAGPEKGTTVADGISKYVSKEGSYRYVYSEGGKALSALQVVSKDGKSGIAANVYTLPEARRKGHARMLLEKAKRDFKDLQLSEDRTDDGKAWVAAIEKKDEPLEDLEDTPITPSGEATATHETADYTFTIERDNEDGGTYTVARSKTEKDQTGKPLVIGRVHVPDENVGMETWSAGDVYVRDKDRRKGVATQMYKMMTEHQGKKAKEAPYQSDYGREFWKGSRKKGPLQFSKTDARDIQKDERVKSVEFNAGVYTLELQPGFKHKSGKTKLEASNLQDLRAQLRGVTSSRIQFSKRKNQYPMESKDKWYSDSDYESRGGKIVYMTPEEFLERSRALEIDEATQDNIDDLKRHVQEGGKLDPLKLYADGKEDGRHRAVVAQELGITKVPVVVFGKKPRRKRVGKLIAHHNITVGNLLHAAKIGGLAVPSFAITENGSTITNFGEITLIAPPGLVDPRQGAKVFAADVYSARYPTVTYKFNDATLKRMHELLDKYIEKYGLSKYFETTIDPREFAGMPAVKAYFLDKKGIKLPETKKKEAWEAGIALDKVLREQKLEEEYQEFADAAFDELSPSEHLFAGYTNMGRKRYKPHTLETVVKQLKRGIRAGEGFNYGVGSLRASLTPQFRSISAIKDSADKLVSKAEFNALKEEIDKEFWEIAGRLGPYTHPELRDAFGFGDRVIEMMQDAARMGPTRALKEWQFEDVPDEVSDEISMFLSKLRGFPTEYFEAKQPRAVQLSEFSAAVVPEGIPAKARKLLEDAGLEIATYKRGQDDDGDDRRQAVAALADSKPELLFSITPFFSAVERTIEKSTQKSASPAQWKAILKNSQGIKTDELKWMGITEWLDELTPEFLANQGGKITKDQILEFIRANKLEIVETALGQKTSTKVDQYKELMNKLVVELTAVGYTPILEESDFGETLFTGVRGRDSVMYTRDLSDHEGTPFWEGMKRGQEVRITDQAVHDKLDELARAVKDYNTYGLEGDGQPQYSEWQTPGGRDYTELLIQLPNEVNTAGWTVKEGEGDPASGPVWEVRDASGRWILGIPRENGRVSREEALARASGSGRGTRAIYSAPHFTGHPNILAHTRFNTRTDVEGRKVLFVEEIQSDWHQQGRKQGYRGEIDPQLEQKVSKLNERIDELRPAAQKALQENDWLGFSNSREAMKAIFMHDDWRSRWDVNDADAKILQEFADVNGERNRLQGEQVRQERLAPDAPFKTSWHELAFKRLVRWAAENGYERIAWTTGEMQAERYNLSRQVDDISWFTNEEFEGQKNLGVKTVRISAGGNVNFLAMDVGTDGKIIFSDHGDNLVGQHLSAVIGEDAAARILLAPEGGLRGNDLAVGGEGMKGFYDKLLVNYAKKLGKKFGATVSTTKIDTQTGGLLQKTEYEGPTRDFFVVAAAAKKDDLPAQIRRELKDIAFEMDSGKPFKEAMLGASPAAAAALGGKMVPRKEVLTEVHAIDVTPEMAESAMNGQPLFSRSPTGRGMDARDLRAEISRLTSGYRTPPIEVYQGLNNMPPHLVRRLRADGGDTSAIDAFFDGDKIVMIADHIMGPAHAADTIYHELVVHYGLRQMVDQDALEEIQDGVWRDMQKAVRDVAERNGLDVNDLEQRRLAAEEVIAYMAGKVIQGQRLDKVERTLWEQVKAAVFRVLDRLGLRRYYDETRLAQIILEANANLKADQGLMAARLQQPALLRSTKAPLWYSPMIREFDDPKLQNIATPDEWKKLIANKIATGKIREAEMKWYDLREWLGTLGVSQALKEYPKAFTAKDMPKGYEQNFQEHLKFQKWFEDANSPAADSAEGRAILVTRALELMGELSPEANHVRLAPVPSQFSEALRWTADYYKNLVATFGDDPVARIPKAVIQEKLRKDQLTFQIRYPTPDDVEAGNSIDFDDPDGEANFDEDNAREYAIEALDLDDVESNAISDMKDDWENAARDYEFTKEDFDAPSDYHKWFDALPEGVDPSDDPPDPDDIKSDVLLKMAHEEGYYSKAYEKAIDNRIESDREYAYSEGDRSWSGDWTDGAGTKWKFYADGPPGGGRDWNIGVSRNDTDHEDITPKREDMDRHFDSRQALKVIRKYIMSKAPGDEDGFFTPTYEQYTLPVDKDGTYKEKLLVWTNREASGRGKGKLLVPQFSHGHFGDDTDFLAHVRSYVTKTTDGKKILVLDELQSDWHQEIRDSSADVEKQQRQFENAKLRFFELLDQYKRENITSVVTDFLFHHTFKNEEAFSSEVTSSNPARDFLADAVSQLLPQDDWQAMFDKINGKTAKGMDGDDGVTGEQAMMNAGIHPDDHQARRIYWAEIQEKDRRALIKKYRVDHGAIAHEDEVLDVIKKLGGAKGLADYVRNTDRGRFEHMVPGEIPYALAVFDSLKIISDFDIRDPVFEKISSLNLEFDEAKRAYNRGGASAVVVPPLQKTWPIALFQWGVREAAERNLDGIALTPGSVHGARWSSTMSLRKLRMTFLTEDLRKYLQESSKNDKGLLPYGHAYSLSQGPYKGNSFMVDENEKVMSSIMDASKEDPKDPVVVLISHHGNGDPQWLFTVRSRVPAWIGKRASSAIFDRIDDVPNQLQLDIPKRSEVSITSSNDLTIWWPSSLHNERNVSIHHGSMDIYNNIVPNQLNDWLKKWKVRFGSAEYMLGKEVTDSDAHLHGVQGTATDEQLETETKAWRKFELPTVMLTPEIKKEALEKGFPLLFSRKWYQRAKNVANRVVQGGTNFDIPDPSSRSRAWNYLVFKLQDKFVDLFKTQQEAAAWHQVAQLPEQMDAYLQQTLFHGRAENGIKEHEKQFVEPLIEMIKDSGYSWEDVEDFLYARHAPEANAHLLRINNGNPQFNSGMTDQEAQQTMSALAAAGDIRKLQAIGAHVDLMTKWSRDQMVMNGLEDAATVQTWENTYKHYVPLKGWKDQAMDPDVEALFGMPKKGKGFDTGGKLTKQRTGRTSRAATILANVVAQAQATVILSEKAKVGRALYDFVTQTPSARLWSVDEVEYMKYVDPNTGLVRQGVNPQYKLADNVIRVKVGGKDYHITFSDEVPQMQRLAAAMKNLSADQIGPIFAALHRVNRFLSAINTSLNPEFTVTNALRDLQTALINLNEEQRSLIKTKILKDWKKAWWAIRRGEQKSRWIARNHTAAWAAEWDEFKKQGAKVGWIDHYKSPVDLDRKLQRMMGPDGAIAWTAHGIRRLGDFIENENLAVENALRLSTYVNLRESGMSQQRAAEYAKNLTVNFNRKGEAGTLINSLYLFFNAAIQGTARMFMAAKNKNVRRVMYGIIAAAMAREILNQLLTPLDDDDEPLYDKIPEGDKERNMIFMLPKSADAAIRAVLPSWLEPSDKMAYVKIPLPYGYNVLDYTGQKLGKLFNHAVMGTVRRYSPAEEASLLVGSMTKAFSPLGDATTSVGQFISPTALDPLVQISENKGWHGGKLMPDDFPGQPPSPDSQKFFSSTPRAYREVAEYLNRLTGGTEVTPGLVDVSPETMQLWVETAGGGLSRFVTSVIDAPTKDAEERELRDVPFLRRVLGAVGDRQTQTVFYDHLMEVERARDEMDAAYNIGITTEEGQKRLEFIKTKYPIAMHMIREAYPNFGRNSTDDDRGRRAVMKALRESVTPTNPTNAEPPPRQGAGRRRAITNDLRDARREIARLELRTGIPEEERKAKIEEQRKIIRDTMLEFNKRWNAIEDSTYGERDSGKLLERLGPLLNGKSKKDATAALRGAGLQETASLIAELPSTPDRFAREFFLLEASKENS